jgi:hypothetical protein
VYSLDLIRFAPVIPLPAIAGLAAVLAALIGFSYLRVRGRTGRWRAAILAAFRVVAVLAVLAVLLRPMREEPDRLTGDRPVFSILVDASASMKTDDVNGRPRYAAVAEGLRNAGPAIIEKLGERYELRFHTFAKGVNAATYQRISEAVAPSGTVTDIATALTEAANLSPGRKRGGVLLISDGRDNALGNVAQAATYLKSLNVPVWAVPVGAATQTKDVFVTARLNQNFLFVNQPATLRVTLSQTGYSDWYARVKLLREGTLVTTEQVMLRNNTETIEFPIREEAKGVVQYRVDVEPLSGESDASNNERTVFARVVDEKTRVLLVEARPYWDSKFLLRTLQRDPNLELTCVFRVSPSKIFAVREKATDDPLVKTSVSQGVTVPRSKEELYEFDCVILGKGVDSLFSAQELDAFRDYVADHGGSLVFSRGRSFQGDHETLAALEPVTWGAEALRDTRFELTPEGKSSPVFAFGRALSPDAIIRELPEMVSVTEVEAEKSLSVIFARVASSEDSAGTRVEQGLPIAAISYQRYGKGKVMSIGATGLWRWAFMPRELAELDDVYARFWGQLIRWLVSESDFLPGQEISFRTDQYAYNLGEAVRLRVRTKFVDTQALRPEVILRQPSGQEITVAVGLDPEARDSYTASFVPESEGEFKASLRLNGEVKPEHDTRFTVYADSIENRFVAADPDLLRQVASVTGGETLQLDQLDRLPGKVSAYEEATRTNTRAVDAWDKMAVFAGLVGLLAIEWFIRRRSGLV